jgi:hypothetical protein
MTAKFNPEHETVLHNMLRDVPGAAPGKMFGYPAYKVNGKLAVGLYDTGIVAKVGPARTKELVGKDGISTFEPMPGRAWKDWVLLTGSFDQHRAIFEEAVRYVQAETEAESSGVPERKV